jgi:hypothetical protein
MPILAAYLGNRSETIGRMAVDSILQSSATRAER